MLSCSFGGISSDLKAFISKVSWRTRFVGLSSILFIFYLILFLVLLHIFFFDVQSLKSLLNLLRNCFMFCFFGPETCSILAP